jgi:hypothetical protein
MVAASFKTSAAISLSTLVTALTVRCAYETFPRPFRSLATAWTRSAEVAAHNEPLARHYVELIRRYEEQIATTPIDQRAELQQRVRQFEIRVTEITAATERGRCFETEWCACSPVARTCHRRNPDCSVVSTTR